MSPGYIWKHEAQSLERFVVSSPWPRVPVVVSCCVSRQLCPPSGSGFFPKAGILRWTELSFSGFVFLQAAEVGTLGRKLKAGHLSFPVEREPMPVPVHHLQSKI